MILDFSANRLRRNPATDTVDFVANADAEHILLRISDAALRDRFGASSRSGEALLAAFMAHRAEIEDVARAAFRKRGSAVAAASGILLTNADFE